MIAHEPGTDGHPFSLKGWFQLDDETQICIWGRIMFFISPETSFKKTGPLSDSYLFCTRWGAPYKLQISKWSHRGPLLKKNTENQYGFACFFGSPHHFKWSLFSPTKTNWWHLGPQWSGWNEEATIYCTTLTPSFTVAPQKRWRFFFGNDEKPPPSGRMIRNRFFVFGREFQAKPKPAFFCGGIPTKTCSCDCYWGERSNCWCVGDMLW